MPAFRDADFAGLDVDVGPEQCGCFVGLVPIVNGYGVGFWFGGH
jgi:hypothetical protein